MFQEIQSKMFIQNKQMVFKLSNIFDRRHYVNTQVQATDSDLQNIVVAQHRTRSTRQLTKLFYSAAALTTRAAVTL